MSTTFKIVSRALLQGTQQSKYVFVMVYNFIIASSLKKSGDYWVPKITLNPKSRSKLTPPLVKNKYLT